jgi:hypothetical protein
MFYFLISSTKRIEMTSRLVSTIFRRSDLDNAMLTDPVSKFRVSQPQTLIDTDFEYGLQTTKWETIETINNIPVFFSRSGDATITLVNVESISGSDVVKVTTNGSSGFNKGSPIILLGLKLAAAEGSFVVSYIDSVNQANIFYYKARDLLNYTGSIYDQFSSTLYPGRVYQSTLYNKSHLVDIITNNEQFNSTLTVTTKFPHGFKNTTNFTLANSTGIKRLDFDASLVDYLDTLVTSNVISYTNSNNGTFDGLLAKNVVPYDWTAKRTLTFYPDAVDLNTSTINIPNHGQTDSLVASNIYYYETAPGNQPIGGLYENSLYGIRIVDTNTIQLRHIVPLMQKGLFHTYVFTDNLNNEDWLNSGGIVPSTAITMATYMQTLYDIFNMQNINLQNRNSVSSATQIITPINNTMGILVNQAGLTTTRVQDTSHLFYGYFRPNRTGEWVFRFGALDVGFLWFGSNALWQDSKPPTPNIRIGWSVTQGSTIRTAGTGISPTQVGQDYYKVNLEKDVFYPIRMVTTNDRSLGTTQINSPVINLWASNTGGSAPFNNFTTNIDNLLWIPNIRTTVPLNIDTTTINFSSQGTSNFGCHALYKCYYINGVDRTNNNMYIQMNTRNYIDTPLSTNSPLVVVPSLYSSNIPWFNTNNLYHEEREIFSKPAAGASTNYNISHLYGGNLKFSYSNITKGTTGRDYKYYYVNTSISLENGLTLVNGVKNSIIQLKDVTTNDVQYKINYVNDGNNQLFVGPTAIMPVQSLVEYDSIFYPSHNYSTDDTVVLTNMDPTKQLPGGLIDGTSYQVAKVNDNFFRLKRNSILIDISTVGETILKFTKTSRNPNADTFYIPSHGLTEGSRLTYFNNNNADVQGLQNETTYTVFNSTDNRFKLATGIPYNLNSNNLLSQGIGTHYFVTEPQAADGNYKILSSSTYSFTLQTPNNIPYRSIRFLPYSALNENINGLYLPQHYMVTGSQFSYSNYYGPAVESSNMTNAYNLTPGSNYYSIRLDTDYIQLAGSYDDAINNRAYVLPNVNTSGSNHFILVKSLIGDYRLKDTISFSNTTGNFITSLSNLDLQSLNKRGDIISMEIENRRPVYYIASNNQAINEIRLWHDITTNDGVAGLYPTNTYPFLRTGDALYHNVLNNRQSGLSNNAFYYIRKNELDPSSKSWYVYTTSNDAVNDINRTILMNPGNHGTVPFSSLQKLNTHTIFNGNVEYVNSPSIVTINTGPWFVNSNQIIANYLSPTYLFPRADGYNLHRAYDGGVEIIPPNNPDSKLVRQTRRYFRYQSGKGLQCSKAINFNAATDCLSVSRNYNNVATQAIIKTRFPHRLRPGAQIRVIGCDDNNWNSSNELHYYAVTTVPDLNSIVVNYPTDRLPSASIAGGFPQIIVKEWTQSALKCGMFDDQNGLYYEYDGRILYACRRNSTKQLPGYASVIFNSGKVTGDDNCRFTTNLNVEDKIVIKGATYKIVYIENDSTIYIQPPYRGVTNNSVIIAKTEDTKIPQSSWSIDPCDGTGPTGYKLETTKIQMVYLDYSWYGAGKVRFGFKALTGEVRYVHEFIHNNNFNEAYLRSGNLPGRYEVENLTAPTYSPSLMHWGTSIIMDGRFDDDKAYLFTAAGKSISYYGSAAGFAMDTDLLSPAPGVIYQSQNNYTNANVPGYGPYFNPNTNRYVYGYRVGVGLTGTGYGANTQAIVDNIIKLKAGTVLRTANGTNVFSTFTWNSGQRRLTYNNFGFTSTTTVLATQYAPGVTNIAYIYLDRVQGFNAASADQFLTSVNVGTDNDYPQGFIPLVSLRLGPSVDNGRSSLLGVREIINRMQINLDSSGVLTTHDVDVQVLLNGYTFYNTWQNATSPSLTQIILHERGDIVSGGTPIYNVRAQGGALATGNARQNNATTIDLSQLLTLGNSILGGDNVYPDGPDVLTIGFNLLDSLYITAFTPFTITARISWKESQA